MARSTARIATLQFGLTVGFLVVIGRAIQVQIREHDRWVAAGEQGRTRRIQTMVLPAHRGAIVDRHGTPLALSQTFYHVDIAFPQVRDTTELIRQVTQHLGVSVARLRSASRSRRDYYLHGPYTEEDILTLRPLRGVRLRPVFLRQYPSGGLARPVVGSLHPDSSFGISGLERSFDSLLAGQAGEAVRIRDRGGRLYDSPGRRLRKPVPGVTIWLTLDAELQSIAETGLADAIKEFDARGGDVVFVEARTGDVLAAASLTHGEDGALRAGVSMFSAPFEPGSTAKLFTAAALLSLDRIESGKTVSGENGRWAMPVSSRRPPRIIEDTHVEHEPLTLERAVQVSSNIAMAKFSQFLTSEEQYEMLRDFGFGSMSGIEFPGESPGRLTFPDRWTPNISGPSHAIGYEFGVTAVQLAAAYGAIANDGVLLAPSLLKEIRDPDGRVRYRHEPEVVRRVVSSGVAKQLRRFLGEAAGESGTGSRVQLHNVRVLGKTGTARLFELGSYQRGKFTASFAGIFPAEDPQLVVITKLVNPRGGFGGLTAAPLTRRMLEEVLAARASAVDRRSLAGGRAAVESGSRANPSETATTEPIQVLTLPYDSTQPPVRTPVTLIDVTGLNTRLAVFRLHRLGLRVQLVGNGTVRRSAPSAGAVLRPGATVTLFAGTSP